MRAIARIGLIGLFLAMAVAPWFSHPGYDWRMHTTSELAGQAMPNAWIMALGFAGFGLGVLAVAWLERMRPVAIVCALFGVLMIAVAFVPGAPIPQVLGVNRMLDFGHSVLSAALGGSFALACALALFAPGGQRGDSLSWVGLAASVALPLGMANLPEWDGALQRLLFAISALWFWARIAKAHV